MPLPGGATDKLGNSYELNWTVSCMAEVLADKADSIRLEPPGDEGKGIEFWLRRGNQKEFHQVKRQQAGKGRWSIADLASVLQHFRSRLIKESRCRCVFVSTEKALPLAELSERAKQSETAGEFQEDFLRSKELRHGFHQLCQLWDGCDRERAWALLRRIKLHTVDDDTLEKMLVVGLLAPLVDGSATGAADALAQHALRSVHRTLRSHDLWTQLESCGFRPTDWGRQEAAAIALRKQTQRFLAGESAPIARIPRPEADQVVATLTGEAPHRLVFLTGEAGSGKSGVAAQVVERVRALAWPVLAFRLDRVEPVPTPEQLAPSLGSRARPPPYWPR
jgi:hypothetical protein